MSRYERQTRITAGSAGWGAGGSTCRGVRMMTLVRVMAGVVFFGAAVLAGTAGAAELKLLTVDAMKPALQELAPAFEAASKHKLKVEYAAPDAAEKKIVSAD